MRRYIMTGAPGAGKTSILAVLRARGYAVVDEAATEVIARELSRGHQHPGVDVGFIDAIVQLQRERQELDSPPSGAVQLFDRSPICTLALARYAERTVTPVLATEVDRVVRDQIYQPQVFFVHLLGFVTPTAARRISFAQSVRFEGFHREAYLAHGFELVEIPAGTVDERAGQVAQHLRAWNDQHNGVPFAPHPTAAESPSSA